MLRSASSALGRFPLSLSLYSSFSGFFFFFFLFFSTITLFSSSEFHFKNEVVLKACSQSFAPAPAHCQQPLKDTCFSSLNLVHRCRMLTHSIFPFKTKSYSDSMLIFSLLSIWLCRPRFIGSI